MKLSMMKFFLIAAGLAAMSLGGCKDSAPNGPVPSLGSNSVKKYVAVGNSLTAGYQSNGLYQSAQIYSYPNLISQQLTKAGASLGSFEQPYYSDPGTPDPATGKAARFEIISLTGPVIAPKGLAPGSLTNTALARPYDNLGIPGIPLAGFMDTTGTYQNAPLGRDGILRWTSGPFPKSVFKQVVALQPDLVTFWLGANDVLGYATSGGFSPSAPVPAATFTFLYTQALGSLRQALPNVKIVVANIPDVRAIPFFNTVGPGVAAKIGPLGVKLYYQKHGETGVASGQTSLTEAGAPLLTLKGITYASFLGLPNGQWYRDNRYPALPPGIDTTKPFGLHPQNPWPDALALDADEQATAGTAVTNFNNTIASVASANGAAVVDFYSFFNTVAVNGYELAGETYTTAFISGALFSLDGVHPSDRGYGIVANEYIKVINAKFGMTIPLVDVSQLPGIPAPLGKISTTKTLPIIPFEAFRNFDWLFRQSVSE